MKWLDALKQTEGALADYRLYIERHRKGIQQEQDDATSRGNWPGASEALGKKKILDLIEVDIGRSDREEKDHARYRREVATGA